MARVEDLSGSSWAVIFNSTDNISISELLARPTVIELKHIGNPEFAAFMLSLILIRVYEHFDCLGPSSNLRALLVIDEAHRVLEELPKALDMGENAIAKSQAVD